MTIFIALIRGINVGGKHKIKMADLKSLFEEMGLVRVETYIQSGNILFESDENEAMLRTSIEHEIEKNFKISTAVILRTASELERLIQDCPFSKQEIDDAVSLNMEGESLYVNLLSHFPDQEKIEYLNCFKSEKDDFRVINRDIYLLLNHSIRTSKLANNLQKLDIPSTMRNWKTLSKLLVLTKTRTNL
ncbi:DUF1697 domain-containing protein [Clostridium aminobutyricum]|uniref:DUF1697 domain-containing protein n=1 Tax=Clostridium aminobutyricum TaxID=33953 RepID=A0A939D9K7_CLOAM|nr:DUF1697 domain-containing protein [Clostridium aminobutyricum]MBN7773640.1 DUF1697 domain-containing protein [Clostridium aminobutyricum]